MSDFEDRVKAIARELMPERYAALVKLDEKLADAYAFGHGDGKKRLREGKRINGRIIVTLKDAELIWKAVEDDGDITAQEEEALCVLIEQAGLANTAVWRPEALDFIKKKIEQNLKGLWSAKRIDGNIAAQFLGNAKRVDFKSPGSGVAYSKAGFDQVLRLIRQDKLKAWDIPNDRIFTRTAWSQSGNPSRYDSDSEDIYVMVGGSGSRQRAAVFVHEATHAYQDIVNVIALRKFIDADAFIAEAVAANELGKPYGSGSAPHEVAGKAAKLLVGSRSAKGWKQLFSDAYDEVVAAVSKALGAAEADKELVWDEVAVIKRAEAEKKAAECARIKARSPRHKCVP